MTADAPVGRRQQILEALAHELENNPGMAITTARLAHAVGVSEAALYRHFPSKAKMFEALIEFAEESVFGLVRRILQEESEALRRCENILMVLLGFSARNPGITRVLLGDALVGEHKRLWARVDQFFNRIETQLRQVLREGEAAGDVSPMAPPGATANLLLVIVEGKMSQYARSGFERSPLDDWSEQWPAVAALLLGR
ncbi:MAG: nucleoid occlusion factor SlmA [Gammaproteobacteria bacterium]|nr:nucleoid occlusion factor SlmA [Gammaproteobacteria bacterium]